MLPIISECTQGDAILVIHFDCEMDGISKKWMALHEIKIPFSTFCVEFHGESDEIKSLVFRKIYFKLNSFLYIISVREKIKQMK